MDSTNYVTIAFVIILVVLSVWSIILSMKEIRDRKRRIKEENEKSNISN